MNKREKSIICPACSTPPRTAQYDEVLCAYHAEWYGNN